jgi:aspartate/methionine/tyrosine aminotransferase
VSLAQGVVYWTPPSSAVARVIRACESFHVHKYCADDGLPELRSALKEKLARENNLRSESTEVMVTSGANQAFVNLVCLAYSVRDSVV